MTDESLPPLAERALTTLKVQGPMTQRDLVARLGCARRSLFTALRRLEDQGLVGRQPDWKDLRRSYLVAQN